MMLKLYLYTYIHAYIYDDDIKGKRLTPFQNLNLKFEFKIFKFQVLTNGFEL